jgi:hypothetical protein
MSTSSIVTETRLITRPCAEYRSDDVLVVVRGDSAQVQDAPSILRASDDGWPP